jgi:hypothetical protein
MPEISAVSIPCFRFVRRNFIPCQRVELKRLEHERQRALHRKMFEEQMRALEQQQAQELLNIPADGNGNGLQHMAASAPTTPPRINALLPGGPEASPTLRSSFARMGLDTDVLSRAVGSVSDKRKSVTYAPVTRSPEIPPSNTHTNNGLGQGYGRAGAKSLPASRRTSASSHDEELAGHLQGLSIAGEAFPSAGNQEQVSPQKNGATHDEEGLQYGSTYNVGMMLDEQLDEEMNSEHYFEYRLPHLIRLQMRSSNYQRLITTSIRPLTSKRCASLSSSCSKLIVSQSSCPLLLLLWTWLPYPRLLHVTL